MTVTVNIHRTGERHALLRNEDTIHAKAAHEIWEIYGFRRIPVLDIVNWNEVSWDDIEHNSLLEREGTLYKFVEWLGEYPFDGIVVEKIGTCSMNENEYLI